MHLLSTDNLRKKYISEVVRETKFGKIHLQKTNFCLRSKETNAPQCGESALINTFKMLLRNVL